MFQIASSKINQNLLQRKKNAVFNLQFTETFEGQEDEGNMDGELNGLVAEFGTEMSVSNGNIALEQQT